MFKPSRYWLYVYSSYLIYKIKNTVVNIKYFIDWQGFVELVVGMYCAYQSIQKFVNQELKV